MADSSSSSGYSDEDHKSSGEGRSRRRNRRQPLRQIIRSQSPPRERPNMSDLRIALLGTSMSENSRVGNLILGNDVFGKKTPPTDEEHSGRVEDRNITVISTDLLKTKLKLEAATQKAFELSRFNPDVIILVLQHNEFRHFHKDRLPSVLIYFGEQAKKHTMILTTDDKKDSSTQKSVKENKRIQQLSAECGGGRLQLLHTLRSDILKKVDEVITQSGHETQLDKEDTLSSGWVPDIPRSSRRIVLVGKSGVGKSAAGNTILRRKEFRAELRMRPVTHQCSVAHTRFQGRFVSVVDTPAFFDTRMNRDQLATEIAGSVYLSSPGPHAFLIVFPVNIRFTEQDEQIPQQIKRMFGEEVLKYSIILFTHGDLLNGETIEELIEKNGGLKLVDQCGGRYHVFNNRDKENREQVEDLLQKIDSMIQLNGGAHYTNQRNEDGGGIRNFLSNNWGIFTTGLAFGLGAVVGGPANAAFVAIIGAAITALVAARNVGGQRR